MQIYVQARGAVLTERFGSGHDGLVYATNRESAVKCLRFAKLFKNERDVYLRLAAHECDEIAGFAVPRMIDSDDELWIVEMQIVMFETVFAVLVLALIINMIDLSVNVA